LSFGKDIAHKGLSMIETLELSMQRLDKFYSPQDISQNLHWVIDVQSYVQEVLKGAGQLIPNAYSMEIE
jgi:hypothetical protein